MAKTLDLQRKFGSVEEYFGEVDPLLVISMEENNTFWPGVRENTTSTLEFAVIGMKHIFMGETTSKQFLACTLMVFGRIIGLIPAPE
jgi:hypothetical protein